MKRLKFIIEEIEGSFYVKERFLYFFYRYWTYSPGPESIALMRYDSFESAFNAISEYTKKKNKKKKTSNKYLIYEINSGEEKILYTNNINK